MPVLPGPRQERAGSIDVIEIDAASHGGVDDARDLREKAFFGPASSRYKIYIIDEAHMVTSAGFNALLKVVEEPPEHLKFIFATTEPEKVIGTIRSRTHHYPFRLVPPGTLRDYLGEVCGREGATVEDGVLPLVVRAGAGSVRDSMSVMDQLLAGAGDAGVTYAMATSLLGYTEGSLLDSVIDAFAAGDGAAAFEVVDRVVEGGNDPRRFVADLLERLRDLVILAAVPDAGEKGLIDAPADVVERMQAQASVFGAAELSRAADLVNTGLTEMRGATSPRLQLELICARVLLPAAFDDERSFQARLDRLERSGAAAFAAPPAMGYVPGPEAHAMAPAGPGGGVAAARAAAGVQAPAPAPAVAPAPVPAPAPVAAPEPVRAPAQPAAPVQAAPRPRPPPRPGRGPGPRSPARAPPVPGPEPRLPPPRQRLPQVPGRARPLPVRAPPRPPPQPRPRPPHRPPPRPPRPPRHGRRRRADPGDVARRAGGGQEPPPLHLDPAQPERPGHRFRRNHAPAGLPQCRSPRQLRQQRQRGRPQGGPGRAVPGQLEDRRRRRRRLPAPLQTSSYGAPSAPAPAYSPPPPAQQAPAPQYPPQQQPQQSAPAPQPPYSRRRRRSPPRTTSRRRTIPTSSRAR
ncbi:DNA polymerase III subunit gamma and tau [Streptomyces sp. MS1.HAVA.3]|uniref:DNA polymerase III subunit gamma and tau n=1 Tax=Streptomyces caledonius TaxID=3134107 RepID=A0ABU8U6R3_9ACTN